jgi:hypothetical protein
MAGGLQPLSILDARIDLGVQIFKDHFYQNDPTRLRPMIICLI